MSHKYEILTAYTDGGARGNPGPAAIGVVLLDEKGQVVAEVSKYIGQATNNVAEYLAVVYALQEALYRKASKVVINTDSQLVAKQIMGKYKVKDQNLLKFRDLILNLFRGFDKVEVREIPREENDKADGLVNRAIDLEALC
ncbi:MAG: ribonuclease HI family protein [Candidatus Omnitrophica bacterium]|nr:ribonuclease HI family protein [Candidatus Omnitrophota bacterium]MBU1127914.1 ribonuclease HI family protein [Candidatus Omnitrophota bacterium]MBU1784313.1 ribonuclease HI family protein [Candidatus Omnitrophota bacterium]MBU1851597.1 ribonuclease HI family protein [Candidatus Omnitrophota bacterium]